MRRPSVFIAILFALCACGGDTDDVDAAADAHRGSTDGATADGPIADAPTFADAVPGSGVIYGLIEGNLVMIDPAVGATANVIGPSAADARFVWADALSTMFAIVHPYGGPLLGAVDLCTGTITEGPFLTVGGKALANSEGIAMAADGTFYVCVDANGDTPGAVKSESVGTIDLETGTVTLLGGELDTLQDDCDSLTFRAPDTLYALDALGSPGAAGVYGVDPATGAATAVTTAMDGDIQRVAWDPTRDVMWGHRRTTRQLVTVDLATGDDTVVGETHTATVDSPMFAFTVARRAVCAAR